MNFESFEEIVGFAIEKEKEAVDFYEDASSRTTHSGAKKIFDDFAKEERKHQSLLEDIFEGEIKLSDYKFEWIPDIKRSNYMVDLDYEKGMPYTDILRIAMKREEKSLQLYNDLAEKTEKGELKELFKMLSQEEAKHKLALETLYDDQMEKMGD
jgi:rubrerythrin